MTVVYVETIREYLKMLDLKGFDRHDCDCRL